MLLGRNAFIPHGLGGNDGYTKLLAHGWGANAGTTIIDSATGASGVRVFTTVGNAQTSTAQFKFNGSSMLFDGTGDSFHTPNTTDLQVSADYTIEAWVRSNVTGTVLTVVSKGNAAGISPYIIFDNQVSGNYEFYSSSDGLTFDIATQKSLGSTVTGAWTHLAVTRSGDTYKAFKNGTQTDTWTSAGTPMADTSPFIIGAQKSTDSGNSFNGHIAEVRLSKGIARWTAAFTSPAHEYF